MPYFVHSHNPRVCYHFSRHEIGKGASLKMFLVNHHFHEQAKVLNRASASKKDVVAASDLRVTCLTIYFLKITA